LVLLLAHDTLNQWQHLILVEASRAVPGEQVGSYRQGRSVPCVRVYELCDGFPMFGEA
jgi:hypothetical protein